MKKSISLLLGSITLLNVTAQKLSEDPCGTITPNQEWDLWFNQKVEEFKLSNQKNQFTIPVIVHVIHGGEAIGSYPNLSAAQIESQIAVLNEDFSGTGQGVSSLPSEFASLVANTGVQFCLATKDENGNILSEPGIDRVNYNQNNLNNPASYSDIGSFNQYMDNTLKPATIWDVNKYMNVWVTDKSSQLSFYGYATFPAGAGLQGSLGGEGTTTNDGFWCWAKAYGNTGFQDPQFGGGRIATHEIGHYLGLRHIWGDSNCGNDYCDDTPTAQQGNQGCPSHPKQGNCGTGPEMFQNFMDYTSPNCMSMFTHDQATRIQTAMTNGTYRKNLGTHGVCSTQPQTPVANFSASLTNVCVGQQVNFTDQSTHNPTSWNWTFQGGAPSVSNQQNPSIVYNSPGTYEVTLSVSNNIGNDTETKTTYINVRDVIPLPYSENFETGSFPYLDWDISNPDGEKTWERTNKAGYNSTFSMYMNNKDYPMNDAVDEVILPLFDFRHADKLSFDLAYALYSQSGWSEILEIFVSTDCGENWNQVYQKSDWDLATVNTTVQNEFIPASNEWRNEVVDISNYQTPSALIKFKHTSDYENNLYIDNINISANTTSISELNKQQIIIAHPNPVKNVLTLSSQSSIKSVLIFDNLGKQIEFINNVNSNNLKINMNQFGRGVYYLQIETNETIVTKKIIK